jgi:hypothetical protein
MADLHLHTDNMNIKGCISDSRPKHQRSHSFDLSSRSASCPPHKQAVKNLCLCRQPMLRDRTQKQMVLPTIQNQNKLYSNQSPTRVGCCAVLRCIHDRFYWMHETRKGGASWLCLWDLASNYNRSDLTQRR